MMAAFQGYLSFLKAPPHKQGNIVVETSFPTCFFICTHMKHLLRKHFFLYFYNFCLCRKCFLICRPRKQKCCLNSRVTWASFSKLSMCKHLFSLKCFLRREAFVSCPSVCPRNILGNNVSANMFSHLQGS